MLALLVMLLVWDCTIDPFFSKNQIGSWPRASLQENLQPENGIHCAAALSDLCL